VFVLDLHVHSCLSPCGALEMHPSGLAGAARAAGLPYPDLILEILRLGMALGPR